MNATATAGKPPYKPRLSKITDTHYTCSSSDAAKPPYDLIVLANGDILCTCPAGKHGRSCKHGNALAALMAYRARPQHIRSVAETPAAVATLARSPRPAVGMQTCSGCGRTRWGIVTESHWCACQEQRPAAVVELDSYRGVEGLLEAFGA